MDELNVNVASFLLFHGRGAADEVLRKCGITKGVQADEVCRITANRTRIDNASERRLTTIGSASEEQLLLILGIDPPWSITMMTAGFYPDTEDFRDLPVRGEIMVDLAIGPGPHPCPVCGAPCRVHQYETRFHSHPRIMGMSTVLRSKVPKLRCGNCGGYPQMEVPWARPRVSYSRMAEREAFTLLQDMPVSSVAKHLGLTMWTVWDMVRYRVYQALDSLDLSHVTMFYADETSSRKGREYITVVCDQDGRIIFMREGRDSTTMDDLAVWLRLHGGDPGRVEVVSCDLGEAYPSGVRRNFPNAVIVYDRFHVSKLAGEALDAVFRRELAQNSELRGLRLRLQRNPSAFTEEEARELNRTIRDFRELSENYRLKNVLASIYDYQDAETAGKVLDMLYEDTLAHGSREMRRAMKSIVDRREGILAWFDHRVSNGYAEGMNSLIQTTKRVARGYGNVDNFIAMVYLRDGHLSIRFDRAGGAVPMATGGPGVRSTRRGSRFHRRVRL
ncbi:MAG: ISL3 family transposase [Thermoplasmata archaeon]|nr:ISL3 family transposase [Thermoplasmata archaeon]